MYVYLMNVCVHAGKKSIIGHLELELHMIVNHHVGVLGAKPKSSVRAASAFIC